MAEGTILYEARENIGYLTLDSPPLNILTGAMMDELADTLERITTPSRRSPSRPTARRSAAGPTWRNTIPTRWRG